VCAHALPLAGPLPAFMPSLLVARLTPSLTAPAPCPAVPADCVTSTEGCAAAAEGGACFESCGLEGCAT
jgi:hypothetical protein